MQFKCFVKLRTAVILQHVLTGIRWLSNSSICRPARSVWYCILIITVGKVWGERPPEFWNATFSCQIISKAGCFLNFEWVNEISPRLAPLQKSFWLPLKNPLLPPQEKAFRRPWYELDVDVMLICYMSYPFYFCHSMSPFTEPPYNVTSHIVPPIMVRNVLCGFSFLISICVGIST